MPTVLVARKPPEGPLFPSDCLAVVLSPLLAATAMLAWQALALGTPSGWEALGQAILSVQAISLG
jgi:hypothetical protein